MIAAAARPDLPDAVLVLGALLMAGAVLSGVARRSFLSLTAVFVLAGFALGKGGVGVLEFDATSGFVSGLATVALIVILFRDGLEVEAEMLQTAWRLPARKLVLAMPITGTLVALCAHVLTDLGWTESFLLGALLSPTDPVLSSSVVTNPRVPRVVRHSLNLESGMNDGLALPAVLAFATALSPGESDFVWWRFVLQDVTLGLAFGVVGGFVASRLLPRGRGLSENIPAHQQSLYGLGAAFAIYGVAVALPPAGNGFIAVFVGAITLGILRRDVAANFEHRAEDIVEIVKLGIFVVFGSLLTLDSPVRRRLGGRGDRRLHAAARPPDRDLDRARRLRGRLVHQGVHGLVRTEGRRDDGVRAVRARRGHTRRPTDLQPRRPDRVRLDPPPRPHRHARHGMARPPHRGDGGAVGPDAVSRTSYLSDEGERPVGRGQRRAA